ncbi:MAG: IclR family transcriptional regulator [Xanthobacteraceae bacterium]
MSDSSGPRSVERAIELIKLVARAEPKGGRLIDLANQSRLSRATTHRLLSGLIGEGLIEQAANGGRYFLGPEATVLARAARLRIDWAGIAANSLRRLVGVAQDVTLLTLRSGSEAVIVERLEGDFPLRTHVAKLGDRHPVGVGAAWIAMLAEMADAEIKRLLALSTVQRQQFPGFSSNSVWTLVREARDRGYAVNPGLVFEGSWGMALPVVLDGGQPVAAVTIAALANRLTPERQATLLPALRREVDVISEMARAAHHRSVA